MKVVIIHPNNTHKIVEVTGTTYQFIKESIGGGLLEAVYSTAGSYTFWCDEEGKLKGQPLNPLATHLWWATNEDAAGQDVLQGTVVVTGGADPYGEALGLDDKQVKLVRKFFLLLCS